MSKEVILEILVTFVKPIISTSSEVELSMSNLHKCTASSTCNWKRFSEDLLIFTTLWELERLEDNTFTKNKELLLIQEQKVR